MQDLVIELIGFFVFIFYLYYILNSINKRFQKLEQEIDTLKRKLKKYE